MDLIQDRQSGPFHVAQVRKYMTGRTEVVEDDADIMVAQALPKQTLFGLQASPLRLALKPSGKTGMIGGHDVQDFCFQLDGFGFYGDAHLGELVGHFLVDVCDLAVVGAAGGGKGPGPRRLDQFPRRALSPVVASR